MSCSEGGRLRTIREYAFCDCAKFGRSELPSGVEYIGADCFQNSELQEITLPGTLRDQRKHV